MGRRLVLAPTWPSVRRPEAAAGFFSHVIAVGQAAKHVKHSCLTPYMPHVRQLTSQTPPATGSGRQAEQGASCLYLSCLLSGSSSSRQPVSLCSH